MEDGQRGKEGGGTGVVSGAARRPSLRERHGGRQGCPLFPAPHAPRLFSSTMLLCVSNRLPSLTDFFLSCRLLPGDASRALQRLNIRGVFAVLIFCLFPTRFEEKPSERESLLSAAASTAATGK